MKLMAKVRGRQVVLMLILEDSMSVGEQQEQECALALGFWLNESVDKL